MNKAKLIALLATVCLSVSGAYASTVYTYTGNPFSNRTGPSSDLFKEITISLTFTESLGPSHLYTQTPYGSSGGTLLHWWLSDGLFDLQPSFGAILSNCVLQTDASGNIAVWLIDALATGNDGSLVHDISTPTYDQAALYGDDVSLGLVVGSPGTWTEPAKIPEPGSFALVLGALALGFAWHRRRARE